MFFKRDYRNAKTALDHSDGLTVLAFFYEISSEDNPRYLLNVCLTFGKVLLEFCFFFFFKVRGVCPAAGQRDQLPQDGHLRRSTLAEGTDRAGPAPLLHLQRIADDTPVQRSGHVDRLQGADHAVPCAGEEFFWGGDRQPQSLTLSLRNALGRGASLEPAGGVDKNLLLNHLRRWLFKAIVVGYFCGIGLDGNLLLHFAMSDGVSVRYSLIQSEQTTPDWHAGKIGALFALVCCSLNGLLRDGERRV